MSASRYDQGLARLAAIAQESCLPDDLNEDTTRFRYIDILLTECLDWNRADVGTEERIEHGILDYCLFPAAPLAVVEAKKSGIYFQLPTGDKTNITRSTKGVRSLGKEISDALEQVARYALRRGIPTAVVTNGWQWVALDPAVGPGRAWDEGRCTVFDSLQTMKSHFNLFWDLFCTEGIRSLSLRSHLAASSGGVLPQKPSATIRDYDRDKARNELQSELQILGDLVLGGGSLFQANRKFFHSHCYCKPGAIPQVSRAARAYLKDRYPSVFSTTARTPQIVPAQTKRGLAAALVNLTNINKPILILGDVGVGKTTFVEHLFVEEWSADRDRLLVIRVDLADRPSSHNEVALAVRVQVEVSLRDNYGIDILEDRFARGVLHSEISRFRKGPNRALAETDPQEFARREVDFVTDYMTKKDAYYRAVFSHLVKGRGKIPVLVIDNVDQRHPQIQKEAFIQAQIAASNWDIYVLLALRPSTFTARREDIALSGYHPRAFSISPPRVDQMILRRLSGARAILDGDVEGAHELGSQIYLQAHTASEFLLILEDSFRSNPELLTFCECMSNGNMRLAQDYILDFMSCGHVDSGKILRIHRKTGGYQIPLHEFVRGVAYGGREYYSERQSLIKNLFTTRSDDTREHFMLLAVLQKLGTTEPVGEHVALTEIRHLFAAFGFEADQAEWALNRSIDLGLTEANHKGESLAGATAMRIMPRGTYYFEILSRRFVYLDAILLDTPIADGRARSELRPVRYLADRLLRCKRFLGYLASEYAKQPLDSGLFDFERFAGDVQKDMDRAGRSARQRANRS